MNTPTKTLGEVIRAEMIARGVSENTAAMTSGISRQTLRRRLASGDFTTTELLALADVIGCTASDLMARAEQAAVA